MQLPFPVYLETSEHIIRKSNESTAIACGFDSLNDFVGKPAFKYFKKESIYEKLVNHKKVIMNNELVIAEEYAELEDSAILSTLSFRMPWYNEENIIIGLFGCSIVLGEDPVAESLKEILKLGLLNPQQIQISQAVIGSNINTIYFTKRELDCLCLSIQGKPAKQVAYQLKLSPRTVEGYLNNIKRKMGVTSKAALIEKGIELLS